MPSKWAALRGSLPTLPEEPTYGDALYAEQDALRGLSLDELTAKYNDAHEEKAVLDTTLSGVKLRLTALERVLDETMDTQNVESVVTNGYRWTRSPAPHPTVADRQALRAWADVEMPDALSLPYQTLAAVTKKRLEDGDAAPPGVEVYMKAGISRRRA